MKGRDDVSLETADPDHVRRPYLEDLDGRSIRRSVRQPDNMLNAERILTPVLERIRFQTNICKKCILRGCALQPVSFPRLAGSDRHYTGRVRVDQAFASPTAAEPSIDCNGTTRWSLERT